MSFRTPSRPAWFAALALATAASPAAQAGDFVDTRLTFGFGDDDVLRGAGKSTPSSPAANFTPGAQNTQFFDNYETKTSGFDNFSNLVVYKKTDSWIPGLVVDGALAIRLQTNALYTSGVQAFRDESSYLRLAFHPQSWGEKDSVQFIGFPMSADRFRLGYSYRISWGGSDLFPTARPAPGAKLQVKKGLFTGYLGVKSALILNQKINEEETNYAFLGGAGFDLTESLKFEMNGGFFQRGANPKQEVLGAPVQTFGTSAQLSYAHGEPVGTSIDFALYRNDPNAPQRFFKQESYPGGLSYVAATEATWVGSTLADPDPKRAGSTTVQPGYAGDIQLRAKLDYWRFHVTGMIRDMGFLTLNMPNLPPFEAFPKDMATSPEFFVAAGADYYIPSTHLTPGLIVGVQQPASLTSSSGLGDVQGNNGSKEIVGKRTAIVREDPTFYGRTLVDVLPNTCGSDHKQTCSVVPIVGAKLSLKLDLADGVSAAGELFGNFNNNRVIYQDDQFGVAQRTFDSNPWQIGFNMLVSMRY